MIIQGIQEGIRTDGRSCDNYRCIELETGLLPNTYGSSRLRLGNTELLAGIKMELGKPNPQTPDEGLIKFHVDCSPNATPLFQSKHGQELSNAVCSHLTRVYANKNSIDLKQLCIVPNVHCWLVHVDILVLEYGGNLCDSVSIATKAALYNCGIPNVTIIPGDEGEVEICLPDDPADVKKLKTTNCPILVTVNKVGSRHIVDATPEEEHCSSASLIFGITNKGLVAGVKKVGHGSLFPESITEMLETAKDVGKHINHAFVKLMKTESAIAKDVEKTGYL